MQKRIICVVERLLFSPYYLRAGDKLDWAVLSHSQCGPFLVLLGNNWAMLEGQFQHVTVRIMLMRAVT